MHRQQDHWHQKLDQLARSIVNASDTDLALQAVKEREPRLLEQIKLAGRAKSLLNLWGQSLNLDDNTGTQIVDQKVLDLLSKITGVSLDSPVVHAGLEHTYGYLFSLIETPYGRKRDRWIDSSLEQSLGLRQGTLAPIAVEGTLLTNATYFLGRILFRGCRSELGKLRRARQFVDSQLTEYNFRRLKPVRIVEELGKGKNRIHLITDLVAFPEIVEVNESKQQSSVSAASASTPKSTRMRELDSPPGGLLIYGVHFVSRGKTLLITTFPISSESFDELLSQECGSRVTVQLKYNGYIENLSREPQFGSRTISQ